MSEIISKPYFSAVSEGKCCEKCVFGSGEHAAWCTNWGIIKDLNEIDRILEESER